MDIYTYIRSVLAFTSLVVPVLAFGLFWLLPSGKKFLEGEFKKFIRLVDIFVVFVFLQITMHLLGVFLEENIFEIFSYLCIIATGLCLVKAAAVLDRMASVYGFKEEPKKKLVA